MGLPRRVAPRNDYFIKAFTIISLGKGFSYKLLVQRRSTHAACITCGDISDFAPGALLFYLVPQPMKEPIGHIQKNQQYNTCEHQCSVVLPEAKKLQQGEEDKYRPNRAIDGYNPAEYGPDDHLKGHGHIKG